MTRRQRVEHFLKHYEEPYVPLSVALSGPLDRYAVTVDGLEHFARQEYARGLREVGEYWNRQRVLFEDIGGMAASALLKDVAAHCEARATAVERGEE